MSPLSPTPPVSQLKSILEILAELKPKDLKSQVNKAAQEEHDAENASPAAADAQVPPALNVTVAKEWANEWAREILKSSGPSWRGSQQPMRSFGDDGGDCPAQGHHGDRTHPN